MHKWYLHLLLAVCKNRAMIKYEGKRESDKKYLL